MIHIMPKWNMKRTFKKACAIVLSMALSVTAFAAAPEAKAAKKAKKITLNASKKKLTVGKKFTLKVKKVKPAKAGKKVKWKSSKPSVASVSSKGVVKAKKAGTAKITATSKTNKKAKATCKITVRDKKTDTEAEPTTAPPAASTAPASQTPAPASASPTAAGPTATATTEPTATPLPTEDPESLKANAEYNMGTVVNPTRIADEEFTKLVQREFDIVTFENEMKGYSLMDTEASKAAAAAGNETEPVCKFEQADEMVEWAIANGLRIRGHVLIWENSMASSFFYKGYDTSAGLVDKETLLKRMQSYATQVVTHFEKKYPNTVISWDVVNEAIDPNGPVDEATGLHLYTSGNFYKILGGEYIKYAFQYAKEAVKASGNPNILLYYNDFNCFQSPKTAYIEDLIDYLNKDPNNKLLDCMGMEGYVLPEWPAAKDIGTAMSKFAAKGVKVGITELTVRLNPDTSKNKKQVTETDITNHAQRCADVYTQYCEFNKANPGMLTNVSMWGLLDRPDLLPEKDKPENERDYDYTIYGTNSGLFTEEYVKKDAFNKVLAVLKSYKPA